jgi:beta-xylosidase
MRPTQSVHSQRIVPFLTVGVFLALSAILLADDGQTGKWGDQGDGTYRNPIIAADYSDPDVIHVGSDYYMVASTFESSPGVTVLHSKDLVNWETIGAAIPDISLLGQDFNWDRMGRFGEGVFAPSLRYHNGKFWVFVNSHSGEGFYQSTATNPAGPWTVTQIKDRNGKPLRTKGWTDPCPFWDDDGKAYLASSHPGKLWFSYLFQMTPEGTQLLDADVDKMNASAGPYAYPDGGTLFSPFHSSEGNKLFKRKGYYYLQHIEFLDKGHGRGTYLMRSKNIYGTKDDGTPGKPGDPGKYDILKFGNDLPGQGGFVDTPDGRWFWIGQFNRSPNSDGRMPNLVPVTWIDDWPVPGVDVQDRKGKFAWQLPKPIESKTITLPQCSDEFEGQTLHPQWMWDHQPRSDKWSLSERPGFLRLYAFKQVQSGHFNKTGNVLNQRHFRSESTVVTIKLDLSGMADGQEAGLANFNGGKNDATLGIVQQGDIRSIQYEEDGKITQGDKLPDGMTTIWIRSSTGFDDINTYSYSLDGKTFIPFGGVYKLKAGGWRGDMIGIYTFNNDAEKGTIDVDYFHYETKNK